MREDEAVYCAGCNARFDQVTVSGICPQCGACMTGEPSDGMTETLLLETHVGAPGGAGTPAHEPDELLGRRLHIYRCEALLGRGAMGRVYLAHHEALHRHCALKVLSPRTVWQDTDYVQRFAHEGRAAAALVHPNIITAHAIGEDQGYHFLEMEFVAGGCLQQLIRDQGRLTAVRATTLLVPIAEGLAAAHRLNILHRDLKPANILLTAQGVPKIADFGLAKRIRTGPVASDRRLAGTPNYMAPELFQGQPASPASDVYALGVCYFVLLTGRLPFVASSVGQLIEQVRTQPLPDIAHEVPDIDPEMIRCLETLLAKDPRERPRDGSEAARLLRAVAGQVRDIESLLSEAFAANPDITWTRCGSRYRLLLKLPEGRRQAVFVEPSDHAATERLLLIYSICCEAQPSFYEEALRLNSVVPHGGLAIRDIDGAARFVMVDTYPRATVDVEEVRRSVLEVAQHADAIEERLTGQDIH